MKALNYNAARRSDLTKGTTSRHPRIRRAAIALTAAVVGVAIAAPLSAVAALGTPAAVHVSGAGVRAASSSGDVPFTFSFDASKPSPRGGPTGTFSGTFPHDPAFPAPGNFSTFSGVVTCLQVNGDTATIGGRITSGFGYDDNFVSQSNLAGDWFITTVQDPTNGAPDTMGFNDYGDRTYFATQGFPTFDSLCDNPAGDIGTDQFPLLSGDITISG